MNKPLDAERLIAQALLPDLVISESDPTATAKELAALIAERDDFLFNGYAPVRLAVESDYMPKALEVSLEAVRVIAHEICNPVRRRKHKKVGDTGDLYARVPMTKDIAALWLNGLEGQWGLKPFRGITTSPILEADGRIRVHSGYDDQSGLWCHGIPDLSIPDEPTEEEASFALMALRRFLKTFPFADSPLIQDPALGVPVVDLNEIGLDESIVMAALMTAVCRPSLELAPAFICDAPDTSGSGSGKGLLVKAIVIIASGCRPAAFTSGHNAEEFDKRLTSALIEARPACFLDNFNAKQLKSDILASVLTESPAMVRPMGHTKTVPLHTRTLIAITGNGIEVSEDMARRSLVAHLDPRMENPEMRKFTPGFLDHVLQERPKLLSNVLTIWRWGRQNNLTAGIPLGNYEVWAQWCRDPLVALGMQDPVKRVAEIKAADPQRRELVTIFDTWWAAHGDRVVRANDLDQVVIEVIDTKSFRKDGELQFSRQRVARWLTRHSRTRAGGYTLTKLPDDDVARPIAQYRLTNG